MKIDVSLILSSHNKFPQNLYTLYSLQRQTFDQTKMEVILVDDGSTDKTTALKDFTAPYHFKYLRSRENLDRAGAKNLGLKQAKGEIVIYLDGEVIVNPDFVERHLRHHSREERIVVCATSSHSCTFSVIHPEFTHEQLFYLHSIICDKAFVLQNLARLTGLSCTQLGDKETFLQFTAQNKKILPLLSREDIDAQRYQQLSFPLPSFPLIYKNFDARLTGYHLAWTFFITRNVSLRKKLFESAGPFNEIFRGWGYEDWEMGFRLYKNGVKFIEDRDIYIYHQEHPFFPGDRRKEQMQNYTRFINLHPEIEVCTITLDLLEKRKLLEVNAIINDYYLLGKDFPGRYSLVKDVFLKLTKQIPSLLFADKPVTRLLQQAGINTPVIINKLSVELAQLRRTGKYRHFLSAFDLLIKL